jgi:hypothetical protein
VSGDGVTPPARTALWSLVLLAALIASAIVVLGVGSVHIPAADVVGVVARRMRLIAGAGVTPLNDEIVWQMRAPRVLGSIAVGALLALSGAILQTLTGNELADPYLLGISSGASVGAVAVLVIGVNSALSQTVMMTLASFAGAIVALVLVLAMATGRSGQLPAGPHDPGRRRRRAVVHRRGEPHDHGLRPAGRRPLGPGLDTRRVHRAALGLGVHPAHHRGWPPWRSAWPTRGCWTPSPSATSAPSPWASR